MRSTPSLADAKGIVVKIGSALIADSANAQLRAAWLADMAGDIAQLHAAGKEVIIVSSGAVALGRPRVGLGMHALTLEEKQAAAAAGQPLLIASWQAAFDAHGINVAQLLLTLDDAERRRRYLNARATFTTLLAHRLVPIVNENDSVATAELNSAITTASLRGWPPWSMPMRWCYSRMSMGCTTKTLTATRMHSCCRASRY